MSSLWQIHLHPWVIADGNYGHFVRGQAAEFALEFHPETMSQDPARTTTHCEPAGDRYVVQAEVVTCLSDAWVIDFGLMAFQNEAPSFESRAGDHVAGSLSLGIDPFFYFEQLSQRKEMPPLVYSWNVERITMLSAPLVPIRTGLFRRRWVIDESKLERQDVNGTDCPNPPGFKWNRKGRSLLPTHEVSFILHCSRFDVPPKRTSATAT